MKEKEDKDALKITGQSRVRGGMGYDLKCRGVNLSLVISPRMSPDDPGVWQVEARSKRAPDDPFVAVESGATKQEALRAVGRTWDSSISTHGLAMFDWEAVEQILLTVRAV
jgi:hypothetical protein